MDVAVALDTPQGAVTVDELAREAGLPVRTIREYQTMKLLPSPTRRGRIGIYGDVHRHRLQLIARLQRRGYSLAGIKDLLEAWDAGANLQSLLGVDLGPAALDETPQRLTRRQLEQRLPGLTATALRRAETTGLVQSQGRNHYLVRSPALLALVGDGIAVGVRLNVLLDLVAQLRNELGTLADAVADEVVDGVWRPLAAAGRADDVEAFLRRGRLLLLQGVMSVLADRLGDALLRRAEADADGDQLRTVIDHIRVAAITDTDGTVRSRRDPQPHATPAD
jgi:DNA-binding transcriptional MerR regulator